MKKITKILPQPPKKKLTHVTFVFHALPCPRQYFHLVRHWRCCSVFCRRARRRSPLPVRLPLTASYDDGKRKRERATRALLARRRRRRRRTKHEGGADTRRSSDNTKMEFLVGSGASMLGFKRYLLGELDILPDAPLRDAQRPAAGFASGALVRMAARRGSPGCGFRRTARCSGGGQRFAAEI
jgi:hypothetical protein